LEKGPSKKIKVSGKKFHELMKENRKKEEMKDSRNKPTVLIETTPILWGKGYLGEKRPGTIDGEEFSCEERAHIRERKTGKGRGQRTDKGNCS